MVFLIFVITVKYGRKISEKGVEMRRIIAMILLCGAITWAQALEISEIRTASDDILVVFMRGSSVNPQEVSRDQSQWTVNGTEVGDINLYAMEADSCDHHVYLHLAQKLVEGENYAIATPYGDTTIQFAERSIFCESIKTNQAAYSALSENNYALFAVWLGDGGGERIEGDLPDYEVFDIYSGETVAMGSLTEIGASPTSGDHVYRIDLSQVPPGGPYKIAVKGYGSSHPFGVGGDFSRRLAHIMFRGQYYQRCGCPLVEPYGWDFRHTACHVNIYDVDGSIGEANIEVNGNEPTFEVYGGYHDAGDADRRAYHMANPVINLMIYEAFPDLFFDGQYNIPDQFDEEFNVIGNENGIPDIIDEAVWGTLAWEYLQNEDGSIHFGTETKGYASPFVAPMDEDTMLYGTVRTDNRAAAIGAGLFMHLARIIQPFDSAYSAELVERAERSYEYIKNNMADPEELYYFVQRYLLFGEDEAHDRIRSLKDVVNNFGDNLFEVPGYLINDDACDNPAYYYSYLVEKEKSTDAELVGVFTDALKRRADVHLEELDKYAYPVGNNPARGGWGHNVTQPQYASAPILYWGLTGEQNYIDGACALMNYILGLNPLGISYVTGLGFHQVHNPHDRESEYTKSLGLGPKPGITVFGPGVMQLADPQTYPSVNSLPKERQFGDDLDAISMAEFTIFQTMPYNALFTVLSQGGSWDEQNDPFAEQQSDIRQRKTGPVDCSAYSAKVKGNSLHLQFRLQQTAHIHGGLFAVNGKRVMCFDLGKLREGNHNFSLRLKSFGNHLAGGVLISKLYLNEKTVTDRIILK